MIFTGQTRKETFWISLLTASTSNHLHPICVLNFLLLFSICLGSIAVDWPFERNCLKTRTETMEMKIDEWNEWFQVYRIDRNNKIGSISIEDNANRLGTYVVIIDTTFLQFLWPWLCVYLCLHSRKCRIINHKKTTKKSRRKLNKRNSEWANEKSQRQNQFYSIERRNSCDRKRSMRQSSKNGFEVDCKWKLVWPQFASVRTHMPNRMWPTTISLTTTTKTSFDLLRFSFVRSILLRAHRMRNHRIFFRLFSLLWSRTRH